MREEEHGLLLEFRQEGDWGWEELSLRMGDGVDQVDLEPGPEAPPGAPGQPGGQRLMWQERGGQIHGAPISISPDATTIYVATRGGPATVNREPAPGVPEAGALALLAGGHALPVVLRDPRILHRRWAGKTEPLTGDPVPMEVEVWWAPAARQLSARLVVAGKDRTAAALQQTLEGNWEGTRLKGFDLRADGAHLVVRVPDSPDAALTGQLIDGASAPATVIIAPLPTRP